MTLADVVVAIAIVCGISIIAVSIAFVPSLIKSRHSVNKARAYECGISPKDDTRTVSFFSKYLPLLPYYLLLEAEVIILMYITLVSESILLSPWLVLFLLLLVLLTARLITVQDNQT